MNAQDLIRHLATKDVRFVVVDGRLKANHLDGALDERDVALINEMKAAIAACVEEVTPITESAVAVQSSFKCDESCLDRPDLKHTPKCDGEQPTDNVSNIPHFPVFDAIDGDLAQTTKRDGVTTANCDHLNPKTWVHRDGVAHCSGCDKYMARVMP